MTDVFSAHKLNLMVKYEASDLDSIFSALADPTRRALVMRLSEDGPLTISALAQPFSMSLPALMKHLNVLDNAGLIERKKEGRSVSCVLTPAPMENAMGWLDRYQRFWSEGLDRLAKFVEDDNACPPNPASPSTNASTRRVRKSTPPGRTRRS